MFQTSEETTQAPPVEPPAPPVETPPTPPPPPTDAAPPAPPPVAPPAPAAEPDAAAVAAKAATAAAAQGLIIGGPSKPPRDTRAIVMRIGVLLVGLILLATLFFAGTAILNNLRKPSASANPSPSSSGQAYFTHNDPKFEYSIQRPSGWSVRELTDPNPAIALVVGPDPPVSNNDLLAVTFHQLEVAVPASAIADFKTKIEDVLRANKDNIVSQSPIATTEGKVGWFYLYSTPSTPSTLHAAYYFLDGDRYVTIVLQVVPATDQAAFQKMEPVFQHVAQSFKSYHKAPSTPTGTATAPATGTATTPPTATVTPSASPSK